MKIKHIRIDGDLRNVSNTEIKGFYRLNEDVCVTINFTDGNIIDFIAKKGYYFDGASIPKSFEWFIKPDDPMLVVASFVHDICFNWQFNTCEWAAELMYAVMRWHLRGIKKSFRRFKLKIKSRVIRRAVETRYAERLFNNPDIGDIVNRDFSNIKVLGK